jgi:hypothetical protein
MIAAIDASGWVLIITAASLTLTQLAAMLFAYKRDALAAQKVEAVKQTLASNNVITNQRLDGIADVGHKTHTLVNNAMGVQLKLNAVMARRLATMTRETADVAAAKAADDLYAEHMAKQAKVDAGV